MSSFPYANVIPVQKRALGFAKEAVVGTYVPPTFFMPIQTFDPVDMITPLPVDYLGGSMITTYGFEQGLKWATLQAAGDFFPDSWGFPLAGLFGVDDTTGASAPYSHKLSLKFNSTGQPTTQSVTDSYGATNARGYVAAVWDEMVFTFAADRLLACSAKGLALASSTEAVPVPSLTTVLPFPVWQFTLTIAGSATAVMVTNLVVTISRKSEAIPALTGSQQPAELFEGYMTATWHGTILADPADTGLDYYLNNTQPSMNITATRGTGTGVQGLTLTSTKVAFESASLRQTGDYLTCDFAGTAIGNATDVGSQAGEGVITATLENALPAGTFI